MREEKHRFADLPIATNHLFIRSLHLDEPYHGQVATYAGTGQDSLQHHNVQWVAICLLDAKDGEEELIGDGGVLLDSESGWPQFFFRLKDNYKHYQKEFTAAFLDLWWNLERDPVFLEVNHLSINDDEAKISMAEERLYMGPVDNEYLTFQELLKAIGFEKIFE